jgi:UDP-glucose 4-epimerase
MNKILITGGAGFIGRELADYISNDINNHILIVDNLSTGDFKKIPKKGNIKFIKCDVNNRQGISEIMLAHRFDYVFHYAAMVGVRRTQQNPTKVLEDIDGIRNILELSKNTNVKRVFYSSSSEVYGEPVEFPQNEETTPLNSRLPYAIVKNIGEAYLKSFQKEYGLDYTIFRFFNTYGSYQSRDFVISKFLSAALQNKDITIYGDGSQTRTFCHISDNIAATVNIAFKNEYINEIINIGSSIETPIKKVAELIIEMTHSKSKIVYLPPLSEGDMTRRKPDNSKMVNTLGKEPILLEKGLEKVIKSGIFELENNK